MYKGREKIKVIPEFSKLFKDLEAISSTNICC